VAVDDKDRGPECSEGPFACGDMIYTGGHAVSQGEHLSAGIHASIAF